MVKEDDSKPSANEPAGLATARSPEGVRRNSSSEHRSGEMDTKEIRKLAKQWDEEDKAAKNQARQGIRRSLIEHGPAPAEVTSPHDQQQQQQQQQQHKPRPQPQPNRRTPSEEKLRATYLQTGMKPGAFPGRGPEGSMEMQQGLVSRQYDTRLSSDNLDADCEKSTEPDIDVDPDSDSEMEPEVDLEQAHSALLPLGPLVEAFVVPEEEPEMGSMPPVKADATTPTVVEGDHFEKPGPVSHDRLLTHHQTILLIAALVGCFLIGAVLVIVLVLLVVKPGGENDNFGNALITEPNNLGNAFPTVAPILPEIQESIPTKPPSTEPDLDENTLEPVPETAPPTDAPTTDQPSSSPSSPAPTVAPTIHPTVTQGFPTKAPSVEPTSAPSRNPSEAPTEEPTPSPPTSQPTPRPKLTPPPTVAPTGQPSEQPTEEPTISPTIATPRPTPLPTQLPTPIPTPRPTPIPTPRPTPIPTPIPTPRPTERPTPRPTKRPTPYPTLATDPPTWPPTKSPTNSPVATSATLPPLDLETTARTIFEVTYTISGSNLDPSPEELDALDALLMAEMTSALNSEVEANDEVLLKAEHTPIPSGWNQQIWVDFIFDRGDLPPLKTLQNALKSFSVSSFLSQIKSVGPTFASTTRLEWGLSIPEYAST